MNGILSLFAYLTVSAIPKDAIFSTKTSSLSHLLPSSSSSNPPTREGFSRLTSSPGSISGLELAFHLLYEFTLGEVSPFHGYLQSLPQKLDLPLTWSTSQDLQLNQAWQWLVGTEVERCLKRAERSSNPFHGMCMVSSLHDDDVVSIHRLIDLKYFLSSLSSSFWVILFI